MYFSGNIRKIRTVMGFDTDIREQFSIPAPLGCSLCPSIEQPRTKRQYIRACESRLALQLPVLSKDLRTSHTLGDLARTVNSSSPKALD